MSRTSTTATYAHGHDDFEIEPVEGLPEKPPEGEQILWQGRPDWRALSFDALNLGWVMGYFGLLAIWRLVSVIDLLPLGQAIAATIPLLLIGAFACALLVAVAYVQARATVYTITDARVVMRIGAALTLTLNIPFKQVGNAMLDLRKGGTGTIALDTLGETRLGFLICWPHARPWHFRPAQPALRCILDAERVARILSDAAEARVARPQIERPLPQGAVAAE